MTDIMMPQMGESIAEGTIVRWIKKVGDAIDRDEPLFEISTDKVDAEIPSPVAGVLTEIRVKEGETVAVNSVVAIVGAAGDVAAADAPAGESAGALPEAAVGQPDTAQTSTGASPAIAAAPPRAEAPAAQSGGSTREELRRQKSSPLVRRIARDHNVDIARINGSGLSGRVTKQDILAFIESRPSRSRRVRRPAPHRRRGPVFNAGENVQVVPMSVMRRKIAEHMVLSAHTSPHVYSVYEVNFSRVAALRETQKGRVRSGRGQAHVHRLHREDRGRGAA